MSSAVVATLLANRNQRANRRLPRGILSKQGEVLADRFLPSVGHVAEQIGEGLNRSSEIGIDRDGAFVTLNGFLDSLEGASEQST